MPSKKVISVLILAIGLVTGIILVAKPFPNSTNSQSLTEFKGTLSGGTAKLSTVDWQSDLENINKTAGAAAIKDDNSSKTLTDNLSQSLMANYLSLKQSGSLNSNSAQTLIDSAVNFTETDDRKPFIISDISLLADNSKPIVSKYGADLGLAFKTNRPKGDLKNELVLFKDLTQNKDQSKVLELQNISTIYKNTASMLAKLNVPSAFSSNHLILINSIKGMADSVYDMSLAISDPVRALRGLGTYQTNGGELSAVLKLIRIQILHAGVVYKQRENGYYFYYGI